MSSKSHYLHCGNILVVGSELYKLSPVCACIVSVYFLQALVVMAEIVFKNEAEVVFYVCDEIVDDGADMFRVASVNWDFLSFIPSRLLGGEGIRNKSA